MREFDAVTKALADENRVRILMALGTEGTLRVPNRRIAGTGPVHRLEAHVDPQTGPTGGQPQGGAMDVLSPCRRDAPAEAEEMAAPVSRLLADDPRRAQMPSG